MNCKAVFRNLCFVLLVLLATDVFAQQSGEAISVIEQIIRDKQDAARIYYVDTLSSVRLSPGMFKKKKFKSVGYNNLQGNVIKLSPAERKHFRAEVKKMKGIVWLDNLFKNSQRVAADSFHVYMSSLSRKNYSYNPKNGYQIWRFSKPILLRNNSICLVAFSYMCHSLCGGTEIAFYKKNENGRWERFVFVGGGVF